MVTTFALAMPVIAVLALGGIDLMSVSADKSKLQDVTDGAALMLAKQMGLAQDQAMKERTIAYLDEQLAEVKARLSNVPAITIDLEAGTAGIVLTANRSSFFGNLLPPGGWNFTVAANAQQMGRTPLCVLSHGTDKKDEIKVSGTAQMQAPGCLVHSNSDIVVHGSGSISATAVQTAGLASGTITPSPQTDAPIVPDPFSTMTIGDEGAACTPVDKFPRGESITLAPGVHCGNIKAEDGAEITLLPGDHFFQKGKLELMKDASLSGDDVVLVFGKGADFKFTDQAQIRLRGRRQGRYAGFVVLTTRENDHVFEISSSAARELVGTLYIPNATLQIKGRHRVADQSPWTVIVAKGVKMDGNPLLVINKNYSSTSTPVPSGVGPNASTTVRLVN